jgi:hypothetical protein
MQQALQLYPPQSPDSDSATTQSRQLRAMDSLNILAFRRGGAAPVPASHDDQRSAVVRALEWGAADSPITALIKADVAQLFRPGLSMKVVWGSISRLCAGGLDGLRMRLVIGSTAVSAGADAAGCEQSLILWSGDSGASSGCDAEEFYQLPMQDTDDIIGVAGLINEALESRDALGRLYLLRGSAEGLTAPLTVLGYFTDSEATLLEEHGLDPQWI